jgi:hypothetical protein
MKIFTSYIVLVIAIGLLGLFWAFTSIHLQKKEAYLTTLKFVSWGLFVYTIELVFNITVL